MSLDIISQVSYTGSIGDMIAGAIIWSVFYPALKRLAIWIMGDRYRAWRNKRAWCYEMHEHAERMNQMDHNEIQDAAHRQNSIQLWNDAYRSKMDWVPERIRDMLSQRPIGDDLDEKIIECLYMNGKDLRDHIETINSTQNDDYLSLLGPNDTIIGCSLMIRYLIEEEVFLFRPRGSRKLTSSERETARRAYQRFREEASSTSGVVDSCERIQELYLGYSHMPEFPPPDESI